MQEVGPDPVADDEIIYRRIPESKGWYDAKINEVSADAFGPNREYDVEGISVSRAKLTTLENAATPPTPRPGKSFFVAFLNAGELRNCGIQIEPDPLPNDPSHAILPQLTTGNRKSTETLERQAVLATLCRRVEGPFKDTRSAGTV